jgi:DNA-directed RNA polymerase I, II, and III subunit RPABC2
LSKSEENVDETHEANNSEDESDSVKESVAKILSISVEKAIEQYRKVREIGREDLTEKEIAEIDKECEIIRNRKIIIKDLERVPKEITTVDGQIVIGPPMLTRFEKARIMGARALQLSLGAPVFIEIPKNAKTSLEIAMEELKQRVIPIVIRRALPNHDFQNIPLIKFQ